MLHVEPAYNWPTEYQAHSRVYRIGQREEVEIVRLFTENTYQEIHEHHMVSKASSIFAAFQSLKEAQDQVDASADMGTWRWARSVFTAVASSSQRISAAQSYKTKNVLSATAVEGCMSYTATA